MSDMTITKKDETNLIVLFREECHAWDMSSFFEFQMEGYKFSPLYQKGIWDGMRRLYNVCTGEIHVGLLPYILKFAKTNKLTVSRPDNILTVKNPIAPEKTMKFINSLDLPYKPRDYQARAVHNVINGRRKLIISPTSSGKSFIIYMIVRFWLKILPPDKKVLLIVPTTSLVAQMYGDFREYSENNGWDVATNCHKIYDGANKYTTKRVVISTWQSIYKMRKPFFSQFGAVCGDEAHNFKAKCIGSIIDKLSHVPYRVGTTGTIGEGECNKLTLEGLFGPQFRTITTRELMVREEIAWLTVKCIKLKFRSDSLFDGIPKRDYNAEKKFIINDTRRNRFIAKLAVKQEKNHLILYENKVQGKALKDMIDKMVADDPSRKVYFFNGDVGVHKRENARPEIEKRDGCIIIASLGVFSTGVSIKNIHSISFAWIGKSSIRVLQSIGRGLRMSATKRSVIVYDIFDDLRASFFKENYSLKHFKERAKIYRSEQFDTETQTINF